MLNRKTVLTTAGAILGLTVAVLSAEVWASAARATVVMSRRGQIFGSLASVDPHEAAAIGLYVIESYENIRF